MNDHDTSVPQMADTITLTEAVKLLRGRYNRPVSIDTARRWASRKKGCRPAGKDGPVLHLAVWKINGELRTTRAAVEEFERQRLRLGARVIEQQQPAPVQLHTPRRRGGVD